MIFCSASRRAARELSEKNIAWWLSRRKGKKGKEQQDIHFKVRVGFLRSAFQQAQLIPCPVISTLVLFKNRICFVWVFDGFLKRRITGFRMGKVPLEEGRPLMF